MPKDVIDKQGKYGILEPMTNYYLPARGLKRLTPAQVQQLDEIIDMLCSMTVNNPRQGKVEITVKNGHVDLVEYPLIRQRLEPAAA